MAVLGLHVFLQRGLNKLQQEMCHKTSMEINSIKTATYHHFHYYATFLFKTPLSTLQYASVNHTLYGKCMMLPQLN